MSYALDFSKLAKLVMNDLDNSNSKDLFFREMTKEQLSKSLKNPEKNEKQLRDLSKIMCVLSNHYKRLCDYYADMATLDWYIEPLQLNTEKMNIKTFKKQYSDTLDYLENMNIKHEFRKIMRILFKEGIFYGYEYSTAESYFIKKLNPDNCMISGYEDGVYSFKFDFSYFSTNENLLESYGEEFKEKYKLYKNSRNSKSTKGKKKVDYQWQELNSERSICIKTDETMLTPLPPFVGVIEDIYEIQDYKSLKKAKEEMQNIAILVGSIPYLNDTKANAFGLDLDTAIKFGNQINQELPDQFGFLLSVYENMELFKLSDDKVGTDKLEEATNNFWRTSGVAKQLFSDSGNTDSAIKYSTSTDEQSVFTLLLQMERWLNRKLKQISKTYKFKANILPITGFNKKDFVDRELKLAQFGLANKIKLTVASGMSQSSVSNMAFLENDVLELHEKWIPLQSSHTQNGDPGRKPKEDSDASEGGDE